MHCNCLPPSPPDGVTPRGFMDDAIRLQRVMVDLNEDHFLPWWQLSTIGAIRVHINSNENTDRGHWKMSWMDFDAQW